ncbi:hypothetical protein BP422_13095 [Brevibacillus formosus]|uniref:Uncharacterized protein n=1 Tax=Brevibacillus formosus TaxID=54913 RepID=A0A220MIL2_9BACL|nr:hypothetical protein [Brevibacillus formosus]ASJ54410.1 hypothetical protein BP422_13095 [Brevibacillus formosus]
MRLSDILRSVVRALKAKYPDYEIYGESVKQGLQLPCFFVYIVPLSSEHGLYLSREAVSVKIVHLQDEKDIEQLYDLRDELKRKFALSLKVKDSDTGRERTLTIPKSETQIIDGDLHFSFPIEFFESEIVEDHEVMQHLIVGMEA